MRLSPIAQNTMEWLGLKLGLVPTPIAYSHFGFLLSSILLQSVDKGIFEAIGRGAVSLEELADTCGLDKHALQTSLSVLATMGLVKQRHQLISLTAASKKWILKDSPQSMYWLIMFDLKVC